MPTIVQECIRLCYACATMCDRCASECIREDDNRKFARCIELNISNAEVCRTAAAMMARGSDASDRVCILCYQVCYLCADECSKHVHLDCCRECADLCYQCAKMCRQTADVHV